MIHLHHIFSNHAQELGLGRGHGHTLAYFESSGAVRGDLLDKVPSLAGACSLGVGLGSEFREIGGGDSGWWEAYYYFCHDAGETLCG
jgi:hypothetical protein